MLTEKTIFMTGKNWLFCVLKPRSEFKTPSSSIAKQNSRFASSIFFYRESAYVFRRMAEQTLGWLGPSKKKERQEASNKTSKSEEWMWKKVEKKINNHIICSFAKRKSGKQKQKTMKYLLEFRSRVRCCHTKNYIFFHVNAHCSLSRVFPCAVESLHKPREYICAVCEDEISNFLRSMMKIDDSRAWPGLERMKNVKKDEKSTEILSSFILSL